MATLADYFTDLCASCRHGEWTGDDPPKWVKCAKGWLVKTPPYKDAKTIGCPDKKEAK